MSHYLAFALSLTLQISLLQDVPTENLCCWHCLGVGNIENNLDELLRYADRNSMAHSIEVRLPFLFHELVEFVFTLPIDYIYREGKTKFILRETAKNYLPDKIYSRTDKIGFAPPQENWLESQSVKLELKNADNLLLDYGFELSANRFSNLVSAKLIHGL